MDIANIMFSVITAYIQIILLGVGLFLSAIAIVIIGSTIKESKKGNKWIKAKIIAIRKGERTKNQGNEAVYYYHPVYESINERGEKVTYHTEFGSANINSYVIGTQCMISPLPDKEGFATTTGEKKFSYILGICFAAFAFGMVFFSLTSFHYTNFTIPVWAVTIFWFLLKFRKFIKPKHLRETVEQFKNRKFKENQTTNQEKITKFNTQVINEKEIREENKRIEKLSIIPRIIAILIGMAMLIGDGIGYNAQIEFIDKATYSQIGPCPNIPQLGNDCRYKVPLIDILSALPIEMRPKMLGTYRIDGNNNDIIVDYGWITHLPYYILMGLGFLVLFSNIKGNNSRNRM